ncbi:MAG TPA: alpha-amylase family glycosyl hydrolase [Bacteroidota bacterium]|nr:alpha-amylase family glycosyl hydrolase [Bacteroidota bacterium]
MPRFTIALVFALLPAFLHAQDSVDVTFRYTPVGNPSLVHLPGEFNNWANNASGVIAPNPQWTMTKMPDGSWEKTLRLRVGGGSGPDGAYQYKFNENGSASGWLSDPLNPRTFGSYGNSIIHVRRPTIFHILPLDGSVLGTATPVLSARIFPSVGRSIDTTVSEVLIDDVLRVGFPGSFDAGTHTLTLALPMLEDGEHLLRIIASDGAGSASDSLRITVQAAALQWLTRNNPKVYDDEVVLQGLLADPSVENVRIVVNDTDTLPANLLSDLFLLQVTLREGDNHFRAIGLLDGALTVSSRLTLTRIVDHAPLAEISFGLAGGNITLSAVQSSDPDGGDLSYRWTSDDALNPASLNLSATDPIVQLPVPAQPGEYYVTLEVRDPEGNAGVARNYFTVPTEGGAVSFGTVNGNPRWVRDAVVYEVFVPAFSASGTLRGVTQRLQWLRDLGVNTLWLMPIMDNLGEVNAFNGGYNIVDFYNVDETLGSIADFDALVDSCHASGIRVVLDITPNHVSGSHPWVQDIRTWKDYSIYRPYIEQRVAGDDRGLGQSVLSEQGYGLYARYSNWSLANLNLSQEATRRAMMDVYRYWLRDRRADGFRLDVYWGPQNRYGESVFWRPFREIIKRYKPEALVLGETDGTGVGSERNYADGGGAMDAGYDWNWYGQIKSTLGNGDITSLHSRTSNYSPDDRYNYYTGVNAHHFRFLENHDEERIAQMFRSDVRRTMPGAAVLLTTPGIPMLYAGQEIGWTGQRDRINFSTPPQPQLLPWYRRLIALRNSHEALRTPLLRRLTNNTAGVYSYVRPWKDGNIIVAANFRDVALRSSITIAEGDVLLSTPLEPQATYYLNDLTVDSSYAVSGATLAALPLDLAAFQSRVLLLDDSAHFPIVTSATPLPDANAPALRIESTAPHPRRLGETGTLYYRLDGAPGDDYRVRVLLHDQLGRLLHDSAGQPGGDAERGLGSHAHTLPATLFPAAGIYHCRVIATHARTGSVLTAATTLITVR